MKSGDYVMEAYWRNQGRLGNQEQQHPTYTPIPDGSQDGTLLMAEQVIWT